MNKKLTKLIVLFAVLGVSLSAIFGRIVTAPAVISAMYRMAFTALLLAPVILVKHKKELLTAGKSSLLACMCSGIFLGLHFTTYLESLKYTTIASSTVLVDTEVLFVALALFALYHERIPRPALIGITVTLVGSVIITLGDSGSGSNILYGDLMALLGALCSCVYTLIGRSQRKHLSTTAYTFVVYSSAALTLLIISLFSNQQLTGYPVTDYLAILGMTVCCTLLGHSIFSWGLRYVSAAFISTAKLGEPVFATLLGILFFSELPRMNQIIGGCIVIGGILIYLLTKDNTAD